MSLKTDVRQYLRVLEAEGAEVSLTRGNHWRVRLENGELVFCSLTPSDRRALANFKAQVKRARRANAR